MSGGSLGRHPCRRPPRPRRPRSSPLRRAALALLALFTPALAPGPLALAGRAQPAVAAAAPAPAPLRLSLQQALEQGSARSLSLADAGLAVRESQALEGIAASRFLPRLDLVGLASYTQVGTSAGFVSNVPTLGNLNLNLGADGYAVLQNSFGNIGLALTYPLLDFGRSPLQGAAAATRRAAQAEQAETRRRSRFAITAAYLDLQLAAALVPVWQRAIALSSELLRDATAIRRRGLAARIDTLQAEALLQGDRLGLAEVDAQRASAASALARLLDLPPSRTVEASDPLLPVAGWELDLAASISRATQQLPLLEALEARRQASLAEARAARALLLPQLGVLLGAGYSGSGLNTVATQSSASLGVAGLGGLALPSQTASGTLSGQFYDWGALLSLRQPLFDGGLSRESTRLAERQAERRGIAQQQALQAITQSVETLWNSHRAAGQQRQAAAAAVQAGTQAVRDARLRYRAGIAPITEVLIAQRDLQAARSALAVAVHRWNLSRAGLVMETGG